MLEGEDVRWKGGNKAKEVKVRKWCVRACVRVCLCVWCACVRACVRARTIVFLCITM